MRIKRVRCAFCPDTLLSTVNLMDDLEFIRDRKGRMFLQAKQSIKKEMLYVCPNKNCHYAVRDGLWMEHQLVDNIDKLELTNTEKRIIEEG